MLEKSLKISKYVAIFSVLALFLVLGVTYAVITWTTNNYNIALESSCFDINYVKGQNINTSLGTVDESVYINDDQITMSSGMTFTSVSIELDEDCYDMYGMATIEANITTLSNSFKSGGNAYGKLKYVVVEYDPTDNDLEGDIFDILSTGSITNTGVKELYSVILEPGNKKDYLVIFYTSFFGELVSGSFGASIDAEVVQTDEILYTPISDFTYYIGTYEGQEIPSGKVLLTKYNGTNAEVNIPYTYTINGNDYSVIVLSNNCFYQNTTIRQVNFPSNILFYYYENSTFTKNSAKNLFKNCYELVEVNALGYFLTDMNCAFLSCSSLVNAPSIPDSVTNLQETFRGCSNLVNAPEIGVSVTDMSSTFSGCTSLVNAPIIPNLVTSMAATFVNCTSLADAPSIPNSVINMNSTFSGCTSLVNASNIPDSVTSMNGTFYNCTSLVNAPTIGNSVESLYNTFSGCTSLVNAPPTIPNSVDSMLQTFYGCTSLISAPVIPSSVGTITAAFSGCTSLTGTIRINSARATRNTGSTNHPFYNTVNNITVEVPAGSTTYNSVNNNKPSNVTIVTY